MSDQERALNPLGHPFQSERLKLLQRLVCVVDAEEPDDVLAGRGERCFEFPVDAALPDRIIIVLCSPGYAGLEALFEGGSPGGEVAAEAYTHYADSILV